jgi:hypothetical protein
MYCSKCGLNNKEENKYCSQCGSTLMPVAADQDFSQEEKIIPVFKPMTNPEFVTPEYYESLKKDFIQAPISRPVKSHRNLWIVLASLAAVLILIGSMGFLFRMKIVKAIAPETYLQMSLGRTLASSNKENLDFLDISKFYDQPVSHTFSGEADGSSIDGSLKYDKKNEKALLDLSVTEAGKSYDNMQLYIAPDLLAVSLPDFVKDTDYLTADPATFADKWAAQGLDKYVPVPDLRKMIESVFGKTEVNGLYVEPQTDSAKDWQFLYENAEFKVEGSVEESIGGVKQQLDVMSYTIPQKDVNEIIQEFFRGMKDSMLGDKGTNYGDYQDQIVSAFDEISNLEVTDDLVIRFYIDQDGYARKIVAEDFELAFTDTTVNLGMDIEIWKDNASTDNVSIAVTGESDGSTAELDMGWVTSYSKGIYEGKFTLDASSDDSPDAFTFSTDARWDKGDTSGENLEINLSFGDSTDSQDMTLTGTLTDTAKETSLSDATLKMTDAKGETTQIDFAYAIKIIPAEDISVDTSDSIPLLEYKPFMKSMKGDSYI